MQVNCIYIYTEQMLSFICSHEGRMNDTLLRIITVSSERAAGLNTVKKKKKSLDRASLCENSPPDVDVLCPEANPTERGVGIGHRNLFRFKYSNCGADHSGVSGLLARLAGPISAQQLWSQISRFLATRIIFGSCSRGARLLCGCVSAHAELLCLYAVSEPC